MDTIETTDSADTTATTEASEFARAAVLGTGAWGTTFAQVLADTGLPVCMWGRNADVVDMVNSGENSTYLPGIELSPLVTATTDLGAAVAGADLVAVVVPVAAVRETLTAAAPHVGPEAVLILLAKGLELGSLRCVHEVAGEATGLDGSRIAVLSGPNLSREIAEHHPTATVVACPDRAVAARVAHACHTPWFRPYVSQDVIGCEIAGAVKNVIAVAIGAAEGMGLGTNTRSTLITRGLAEMTRLGTALGANPETFAGLAGIGDLVATCSSRLSRNYSFGFRLGQGMTIDQALALSPGVVEGIRTAAPLLELAARAGVDMPITEAVVQVAHKGATIAQMGEMLLSRPQKMDGWRIDLV
ncbi:NAD(P)-dependent glycerol-3-phosphate dehydrogenase [Schaalia sp. 19OD2882]|uniref:NAD(P)H-dependent glycerol-3-phosphate dehydrogenase n=1 Tax=Schaalia sp. 19OD2882 TaxID=2794089 RepID=UPI001C1EDC35|nr:NAD(P)H-dependent glycerol-3-phosphate dehydrogenase [Schaalia sp. 19OD2882]QWW19082.1 NAD(P)-dependent glycerol-3-phosphate dehydrogenase [Schaalia sp. 19OD2882]